MQWIKTFVDTRVGYASDGYLVIQEGDMYRITNRGRYVGDEPTMFLAKERAEKDARQQAERKYR